MTTKFGATAALAGLGLAFALAAGHARADLVANGNFLSSTNGAGQLGYNTNATGWSVPDPNAYLSFAFLFTPGIADTAGVTSMYGNLQLWGWNNNGLSNIDVPIPGGGNFLAEDGAYQVGAISQTIAGLTPGASYTLEFWWAAAQQQYFYSPTTEAWAVSLGGQTETTATVSIPSQAFSGWQQASLTFTADNVTGVLSFLANGTPSGVPPFALLADVSLTPAVPEPTSIALLGAGIAGLACLARRRIRSGGPLRL